MKRAARDRRGETVEPAREPQSAAPERAPETAPPAAPRTDSPAEIAAPPTPLAPAAFAERVQVRELQIAPAPPRQAPDPDVEAARPRRAGEAASEIAPPVTQARDALEPEEQLAKRAPSHGRAETGVDVARVEADYLRTLRGWLDRHKVYPQRARQRRLEGTVLLHVEMARDGEILSFYIARSSGHYTLDDAVARMIEESAPLPPLPASMGRERLTFNVPISFSVGG